MTDFPIPDERITHHTYIPGREGRCCFQYGGGSDRDSCGATADRHFDVLAGGIDKRPHSRACGPVWHAHGGSCSTNCPTCHGQAAKPEPEPFADKTVLATDEEMWVKRDAAAQVLIGLLRYHLGDHEAAGKDYPPYRKWKSCGLLAELFDD